MHALGHEAHPHKVSGELQRPPFLRLPAKPGPWHLLPSGKSVASLTSVSPDSSSAGDVKPLPQTTWLPEELWNKLSEHEEVWSNERTDFEGIKSNEHGKYVGEYK